jgi:N-acetylmuramoyl-L-alanine amidase/3D (Asp-Asp-Asp) domain-containing protein
LRPLVQVAQTLAVAGLLALPAAPAAAQAPATASAERAACLAQPIPGGPHPLAGHVIVVDPGHGMWNGSYTGARGVNGVSEDANVLDIGCRLVQLLSAEGADVYITRGTQDPGAPPRQGLVARVRLAENVHADVFLSLHENDNPSPGARGVTTYYTHPSSRTLAQTVQRAMVAVTGLRDDGVQTAPFYVTRMTTMPSVLVEGGFLSNPAEARQISTPAFHAQEAEALNRALLTYFGAPTGTASRSGSRPSPAPARNLRLRTGPAVLAENGTTAASGGAARITAPAGRVLSMIATAYGPSLRDNYPYGPVDAFGAPLKAGDVAVDPRVIPLGTRVYVTGYHSPYLPAGGFFGVARDTGGAIKGNRIDIFLNGTPAQVASFGIQHVRVTILG